MKIYICKISDFEDLSGLSLLTKERKARVSRYLRKKDKLRCLCGGLLIRFVFGDMATAVTANQYGKPYVPNQDLFFNLSHAGDYVVIATDEKEIGIDIEDIKAASAGIAEKCFTADEQAWLKKQSTDKAFYTLWTAKESIMKAVGKGFHIPPESFSVLPIENAYHTVDNTELYLRWYEFDGHMICIAAKTAAEAEICRLNKDSLTAL